MAFTSKLFNLANIRSKTRFWDQAGTVLNRHKRLRASIQNWAALAEEFANSKEPTEQRFKSEFLDFFFAELLDYASETKPRAYRGKKVFDFKKETKSTTDRKKPDATLGVFIRSQKKINVRAVVEIKGFEVRNLDARSGRDVSPVAQAYEYQSKFPGCEWIVVSNMDQFRLYHVIQGTTAFLQFNIKDLLDEENFLLLYYVFCRERLISAEGPYCCRTYHEIEVDWDAEKAAIDALFPKYEKAKQKLLSYFEKRKVDNPLQITQKLLNRFLFVNIACAKEIIPRRIADEIDQVLHESSNPFPKIRTIFGKLDKGDKETGLEKYNGGLFKFQPGLDDQNIPKEILRPIAELGGINYSEEELNTEILGKVFQKSLANTILDYVETDDEKDTASVAEKTGAVYTSYFVAQAMSMIAFKEMAPKSRKEILNTKVLDPCCGSGTFIFAVLNQFRNYLIRSGVSVDRKCVQSILDKNIAAIDINEAAVEITKLSLYLDLADKILPLPDCKEGQIFDADTLRFAPRDKFDVIIGNPPYVRNTELKSDYKAFLESSFQVNQKPNGFEGSFQYDIYMSFFEKARDLLADDGVLVFICSNKFLFKDYGIKLRDMLVNNFILEKVYDVSQLDLFRGVSVYPYIFVCRKRSARRKDAITFYSGIKRIQDLAGQGSKGLNVSHFRLADAAKDPDRWLIFNYNVGLARRIERNLKTLNVEFARGVAKAKLNDASAYTFVNSAAIAGTFIDNDNTTVHGYVSSQTAATKDEEFGKPLIVFPRTVPRKLMATITSAGDHIFDRVYYFDPEVIEDEVSRSLLLPYFNSTIATYHYAHKYGKDQISGGFWDLSGSNLRYLFALEAKKIRREKIRQITRAFEAMRRHDVQCHRARAKFSKKYKLSDSDLGGYSFQGIPSLFFLERRFSKRIPRSEYMELLKEHARYRSALFKLDLAIGSAIGLSKSQIKSIHDTVMRDIVEPKSVHTSRLLKRDEMREAS